MEERSFTLYQGEAIHGHISPGIGPISTGLLTVLPVGTGSTRNSGIDSTCGPCSLPLIDEMQCAFPITLKTSQAVVGCGRCMPCRINRRREWELRLLLESFTHADPAYFLTLTYDPKTVPRLKNGELTLRKEDLQKFLKRLRFHAKKDFNASLRFAACGEYGSRTQRPHYHLVVWGLPGIEEDWILKIWAQGFIQLGVATLAGHRYLLGYILKRMTTKDDERLNGREPEFFHGSRHPPLGMKGLKWLANIYNSDKGQTHLEMYGDVERIVRVGGRIYKLSYYIAQKLREELSLPTAAADRPPPRFIELFKNLAQEFKDEAQKRSIDYHEKQLRNANRGRHL